MDRGDAEGATAAHDWRRFVADDWGGAPARMILASAPLDAGDGFALVRTIARPFRDGLRFFVLPALRFRVGETDIRAPGDLLPDASDASIEDYLHRLHARLRGEAAWLEIEQPFVADHDAWSAVREVLQCLWDRAGVPVLPLVAHLLLGRFDGEPDADADAAGLLFPLHGGVRLRIARADGAGTPRDWEVAPGTMVYWPAGWRGRVRSEAGALALRLTLPQAPARVVQDVRDLLIGMLQPVLYPDGRTPAFAPDAADGLPPMLDDLVREVATFVSGDELETALRVKWAARCSAAALEPVPPRAQPRPLRDDDRIRLARGVRIVVVPMDDDVAIWAVDGHAIGVRAAASADALRQRLEAGGGHRIADLCDGAGGDADASLRVLLDRLHAARGVVLDAASAPLASPGSTVADPTVADAVR